LGPQDSGKDWICYACNVGRRGGDVDILRAVPALGQANPQPLQPPNPRQGVFKSTPQEQAACAPDAFKHCMSMGSDEVRVLGCLQQNRQQISAACRIVLESHGK
jgi:hypothetical protein